MLKLNTVEDIIKPFLKENNLSLYEVVWANEFGYKILRVAVDKKGGINSDDLALVNNYLSEKLDKYESDLPSNYMLEVCSPGAEKELKTIDEIKDSIEKKVNVTTAKMVYEGKLISFDESILKVLVNLKGRMKKIDIPYNEVKVIRLAV